MNLIVNILIIKIILFTLTIINCQEQNFVSKPIDTNVNIGDTAILKCSVTGQHGDVQWIHDGTALGYDRNVRGKPRYQVIWNENEDTEYHLRIVNVTLDDEGTYACQVAPIGEWDTKLEAKAKLTVLIAPTQKPEIIFNDETRNSNDVIHIRETLIKSSKFICKIRRTKPIAQIKWFLNGTQLTSSSATITELTQKNSYLEDLTSTLEFKPNTQFNNSLLKCQVYHLGFGSMNTDLVNMSAILRLVVVYPPTQPVITGYDNQIGVLSGTYLKLNCASSHRFPPAKLTWFKNKAIVSTRYDTVDNKTESLYEFKVDNVDNQVAYKCEAMNQALDTPLVTELKLNVLFGPTIVNLDGVFEAKAGDSITALCTTDSSNPVAQIKFQFDSIYYEPQTLVNAASTTFGQITNATFTKVISREHNGKELKCFAENQAAKIQKVVSKYVRVLHAPESVDLIYPEENKTINEGIKVKLTCVSKGGNPIADIDWNLVSADGTVRTKLTALQTQTFVFTTESVLEIILRREYHNQFVECTASNKVGTLKKSVKLNISYLPSTVKMEIIEPIGAPAVIKAGTKVLLACTSSKSNPESQITWFKDSYLMQIGEGQTNVSYKLTNDYETVSYVQFTASSSDHLKEFRCDVRVKDMQRTLHASLALNIAFQPEIIKPPPSVIDINEGAFFVLNLTARANPVAKYSCSASNSKTYQVPDTGVLNITANRTDNADFKCLLTNSESTTEINFRLNVKYAPSVSISTSQYIVNRADQVTFTCLANANPLELNNIEWKLNNKTIQLSDTRYQSKLVKPSTATLTINPVVEGDDGDYSCHISNGIGTPASVYMKVLVKRPPNVLKDSILKAAEDSNQARSAKFVCKAQAYPDVQFKWRLFSNNIEITNSSKYTISNTKVENTQISTSTLIIHAIVSSDYGHYICETKNDVGPPVLTKATLTGKHQPEQPSEFRVLNITRNTIELGWRKNFDGGDTQKFRIRYRKDTMDPTYKYIETESDQTSVAIDNLEMATRYIINIQSFNKYGTDGYLKEPLVVQTDFGFNDVNQSPIYNGNDLPLTIILIVCGVGTLLLLFNVILIIYFIRKRKRKGETDSTTGTNETDTNTMDVFTPPPPYPDELNYQFDGTPHFYEDENKPFVPHSIKVMKKLAQNTNSGEFSIEYATPINNWNDANNVLLHDDVNYEVNKHAINNQNSGDTLIQAHAFPYDNIRTRLNNNGKTIIYASNHQQQQTDNVVNQNIHLV